MDTLLGIPIGVRSLDEATSEACAAIDSKGRQIVFACANSNSMNVARVDPVFRQALIDADQLVADGSGVTLIARLSGKDVGPRIIGQQYFESLMAKLKLRGSGRVFFFGSSQEVLNRIEERFLRDYPQLTFCGAISPPFGAWDAVENADFVDRINAAQPDVLWVGMTAPKQEKWTFENRHKLSVSVIGSIGAVFDFFAGTVQSSPLVIRKLGLEALYRLAVEPRRLWRRVLISNVNFIRLGLWREVMGFGRGRVD